MINDRAVKSVLSEYKDKVDELYVLGIPLKEYDDVELLQSVIAMIYYHIDYHRQQSYSFFGKAERLLNE